MSSVEAVSEDKVAALRGSLRALYDGVGGAICDDRAALLPVWPRTPMTTRTQRRRTLYCANTGSTATASLREFPR